jgi:2'-5' RNA ligase
MARLRTFIGIDLGEDIRDRCVALQETLARAADGVKWVEADNLHVTLLFLGEVVDRDVPALCEVVADCCATHEVFPLEVAGLGSFGPPRRPRTVWVGVGEGHAELVALHEALEKALLQLGCYRREDRQYEPHITLGRVKNEGVNDRLVAALTRHAKWVGGTTEVDEVLVLSSELRPQGPVYTVLSRAKLGVRGEEKSEPE